MNVFHKFTRMSLLRNKSRTLVTIIGIMLSMALVTAVIEGANSGVQYLVRAETARTGAFHGYYYDVDPKDVDKIRETDGIKGAAYWQEVGWADIGSNNEDKPYLLIESVSDNFTDFVSVDLIEGRMPESDEEILLPEHLAANGGVSYKVGDEVSLEVGKRTSDGYDLTVKNAYIPEAEEITETFEKTYKVVGIYARFDYIIESYSCPAYTALTKNSGVGNCNVFFTIDHPSSFFSFVRDNGIDYNYTSHSDLLSYSGSFRNGNLTSVLYGLVGILIFLIAFGSVSLIYNSFSISVGERTKQFGILKSVGATKKQIRGTVIYEALLLSVIGIPLGMLVGCLGIGITLWRLQDSFSFLLGSGESVKMFLVISPAGLAVSAAVCVVTTLISAWIPAKRAIRISPIDSIRQTEEVKIREKDVRTWGFTRKLFGFEGMLASKNFGRNRKRCRSTTVSLFLSITLFISASSFCAYMNDAVEGVMSGTGDTGADIRYYSYSSDLSDPQNVMNILMSAGEIEKGAYHVTGSASMYFDSSVLDQSFKSLSFSEELRNGSQYEYVLGITFLDDDSFRSLCRDNNLSEEEFFDKDSPKAVACNDVTSSINNKWYGYNLLDKSALPISGYFDTIKSEIDGYILYGDDSDENGNMHYYYYPQEYLDEYNAAMGDSDAEIDESQAKIYSEKEVQSKTYVEIGALIEGRPYYLQGKAAAYVIYPYSVRDSVLNGVQMINRGNGYEYDFIAENHAEVYERMERLLGENGIRGGFLIDVAEGYEQERTMLTVINVFSYGFIILISLIATANVFNTISTNVSLRRREFAMLKSVGLTNKGFHKMMNFECIIYGVRGIAWGLPAAVALTYLIYLVTDTVISQGFYIPWHSVAIAVGSVFAVVFATMIYAMGKIRKDNPIDALKNENL